MDFSKISGMEGHYDDEDEVHFYYDNEERIAHAPRIVKDYYSGKFSPRGGLFRSLVSTTGNKLLLVCVVVCAASVVVLHRFGDTPYRKHMGQVLVTAGAFVYGDDVYASVKAEGEAVDGALLECTFTALDNDVEVVAQKTATDTITSGNAELKTKFRDYDIKKVVAQVTYSGETKTLVAEIGGRK